MPVMVRSGCLSATAASARTRSRSTTATSTYAPGWAHSRRGCTASRAAVAQKRRRVVGMALGARVARRLPHAHHCGVRVVVAEDVGEGRTMRGHVRRAQLAEAEPVSDASALD